ncbi:MAG: hypothetical protein EHM55_10250 [Acidobacteria bacterium]|nr:MAG: hypothetical protein EHM55_10250 [Acidobacteriota bacterium]
MARNRQRELALASVAILVLATAVWTMRPGRPSARASGPAAAAATGAAPGGGTGTAQVNLEALGGERPEPEESVRNPFRFKAPPAPPPVVSPPVVKHPQAGQVPAGGPPQPPAPPRITLKYIGDMADPAKPGAKVAILSDARGVYYGREGEVIEGRYRIVKIGVESVDLAYLDGRGRQTIRQNGQ